MSEVSVSQKLGVVDERHCDKLHHTVTRTATHCVVSWNMLLVDEGHPVTHCNALQQTATSCKTLQQRLSLPPLHSTPHIAPNYFADRI